MLIQKEIHSGAVSIKAYQPGMLNISGKEYNQPLVLTASTLEVFTITDSFENLKLEDYASIIKNNSGVEILIIGTGAKHLFVLPSALKLLNDQGIAVESMATRQACHTFQVLTYELRKVVALMFL